MEEIINMKVNPYSISTIQGNKTHLLLNLNQLGVYIQDTEENKENIFNCISTTANVILADMNKDGSLNEHIYNTITKIAFDIEPYEYLKFNINNDILKCKKSNFLLLNNFELLFKFEKDGFSILFKPSIQSLKRLQSNYSINCINNTFNVIAALCELISKFIIYHFYCFSSKMYGVNKCKNISLINVFENGSNANSFGEYGFNTQDVLVNKIFLMQLFQTFNKKYNVEINGFFQGNIDELLGCEITIK